MPLQLQMIYRILEGQRSWNKGRLGTANKMTGFSRYDSSSAAVRYIIARTWSCEEGTRLLRAVFQFPLLVSRVLIGASDNARFCSEVLLPRCHSE